MPYPYNANDSLNNVNILNGEAFPYGSLVQPRMDTVEEWFFQNNADNHPIHVHVNDLMVTKIVDPNNPINNRGALPFVQDVVRLPAGNSNGNVTILGRLSFKTLFLNFTGSYVWHCHRLYHEDTGLMTIVNVIPKISIYAIAVTGSVGVDSIVNVYNQKDSTLLATVTPFKGFNGILTVAVGDVNADRIFDLVVGIYSKGYQSRVLAFSGQGYSFSTLLADFKAFPDSFLGGIRIGLGGIKI